MAGEGVVGLAVYEEADGGDLRKCGVEGADDGLDGEGFDLNAGGVVVDEGAAEVDDGVAGRVVRLERDWDRGGERRRLRRDRPLRG